MIFNWFISFINEPSTQLSVHFYFHSFILFNPSQYIFPTLFQSRFSTPSSNLLSFSTSHSFILPFFLTIFLSPKHCYFPSFLFQSFFYFFCSYFLFFFIYIFPFNFILSLFPNFFLFLKFFTLSLSFSIYLYGAYINFNLSARLPPLFYFWLYFTNSLPLLHKVFTLS